MKKRRFKKILIKKEIQKVLIKKKRFLPMVTNKNKSVQRKHP